MKSKICLGCEPLGGHNWGKFDEKKFKNLFSKAYSMGVNFFDTAAIYGLGKSEKRLKKYLGKNIKNCYISTKGGIIYKNSKIEINGSLDFVKYDLKQSLLRLDLKEIYLYTIHHFDSNQDYRPTFDYLNSLRQKNIISKIGVSNISLNDFRYLNKIYKIDFLQIPVNVLNLAQYRKFKNECIKFKVEILPYNILMFGLLASKNIDLKKKCILNQKYKHRLKTFLNISKSQKIVQKINNLKYENIHKFSLQKILNLDLVDSIILGMSNIKQLKTNLDYINS